jgi:transposase
MASDLPSSQAVSLLKHGHHQHSKPKSAVLKPQPLPTSVEDLQAMVMALQHEVAQLRRMLFGRRSERLLPEDAGQGLLFGSVEPQAQESQPAAQEEQTAPEAGQSEEDEEPAPRRKSRHHGRRPLPEHLMRCIHDIHPPAEEQTCSCCGQAKTLFGADITEELEMIPPKYFVNQYVRHKYACPHCQGDVSQGPLPARPIDKGIPGPGFLADLVAGKYSEHLPLYRLQERYRRANIELSLSSLCDWVAQVASLTAPIVEAMKQLLLSSRKVHTDDTPITVLDPAAWPVHSRKGYMWVYISETGDVVFDYTDSHNRDGPASFLKEYRGYLQADAFSGYDRIYAGGFIHEVACWAHARRKFYDTLGYYPEQARRILAMIAGLYAVESRARKRRVPAERLLAWRQRFSRRRLARLRRYLDELSVQVLPKSPLGKAISYTLNNWQALNRYTEAAFLDIDNNVSERQIKQLVIGRKNWMFAGSEQGARNAAILVGLVVSCKLAGVDPFAYFRDVLTRVSTHPASRVHELIPREWKLRFGPQTAPAVSAA